GGTAVVRRSACMAVTGMAWAAPASPRAAMKANAMVFFMDVLLCCRARIVVEAAGGGRYNGKCVDDRRTLREPHPANLIHEPVGWVERKRNPSSRAWHGNDGFRPPIPGLPEIGTI